jgi:hypothetical protein
MTATLSLSDRNSGYRLDLAQVLFKEGRGFIADAYRFALGREPDAEGVEYYVRRLRSGQTKQQILAQLYLSREARLKGHYHPQLARLVIPYRIRKLPVVGWLVDLALTIQGAMQGPRFARAATSNASLVGEELHASLQAMEQRLAVLCAGRSGPRAARQGPAAGTASFAALPASADRLSLEELVDLSERLQERNQKK